MPDITSVILVLIGIYLLLASLLYLFQRRLIYYPVSVDPNFVAEEILIDNQGIRLHGWVLNPGKPRAVVYFGGNSELITHRQDFFEDVFRDHSTYLINYRGYGKSSGKPSEAALFADALAIYDRLREKHVSISAYGRSLGSGVAVYLASQRALEKLILLTPYDSVAEVAQKIYPMFPVRLLIKDRFDSSALAGDIRIPVMITSAEFDHDIKLVHTLALKQQFTRAPVRYLMIAGAAHNDIVDFPGYRTAVRQFIQDGQARPGDS